MTEKFLSIPGVIQLEVTIGDDQLKDGAIKLMKSVRPQWNTDDIVCKVYTDGITNKLVGCRHKDDTEQNDSVLVRLYGQKTEKIIDRDVEKVAMYLLNEAGCSKPLYCQFNNGISYGFIAGSCLTADSVRDEHIGRLVAQEMAKVAAIDPLQYCNGVTGRALEVIQKLGVKTPCAFSKMRTFLSSAPDSLPDEAKNNKLKTTIPSLGDLEKEIDELEAALVPLGSPVVFSHNDVLLNNIVHNKKDDRCFLIDFEYASYNYQAFELGNHFCEWAGVDEVDYALYPDKESQLRWLTHYLTAYKSQQGATEPTPTDRELEILYVQVNKFSLAANLFWGIWALVQARFSAIDFDFLDYGKIRLDQYFKTKEQMLSLKLPD